MNVMPQIYTGQRANAEAAVFGTLTPIANENAAPVQSTAFEVGQTYSTRSACDYDCIFSYVVISRTAKRVTLDRVYNGTPEGSPFVRGVSAGYRGDGETIFPEGKYSMCPVLNSEDN